LLNSRELDSWLLRWHTIKNITLKIYTYCLNENNGLKIVAQKFNLNENVKKINYNKNLLSKII